MSILCLQGEPEFERLKRELEEVKNAPRGLEGTFRSAAEMERHRAQMADAAIEEQLEVQTAFRYSIRRRSSALSKPNCICSKRLLLPFRLICTLPSASGKVRRRAKSLLAYRRLVKDLHKIAEVAFTYREHGAKLQTIYDKRQRTELDIARREQEIKQLKGVHQPLP